jgi:orotate phosphoribosyltransferase
VPAFPRFPLAICPREITFAATMPSRYPELVELLKRKSLRHGDFTLASGAKSTYYIDGKMTCLDAEGATLIAKAILNEIKDLPVDAVGGMDMGATPIVGSVAVCSFMQGRPLPVFVVRKDVKQHGTMKLIEGPLNPPCKVVIVDDVITTGGSIMKAIDAVKAVGCQVLLATCVLDRDAGAAETFARLEIPYRPLVTLADLGISSNRATS